MSVSGPALSLLTSQKLSGNIGELKNIVKVSAAKAYAEQREQPEIHVTIHHLQKELLAQPITKNTAQQGIYITQDQTLEQLMEKQQPEQQRIVKSFEQILIDFKKNNCLLYSCEGKLKQEVIQLFDFCCLRPVDKKNTSCWFIGHNLSERPFDKWKLPIKSNSMETVSMP